MAGKRLSLVVTILGTALALAFSAHPGLAQSEGRIGGIVYEDRNGNGIREEGEPGLRDIEVRFDSGGWNTTISTAETGGFGIDLNPATWEVTVLPGNEYRVTTDETLEAFLDQPGDTVINLEFGLIERELDEEGNEVLPDSGGPFSTGTFIAGLVILVGIGATLVVVGQRRSRQAAL